MNALGNKENKGELAYEAESMFRPMYIQIRECYGTSPSGNVRQLNHVRLHRAPLSRGFFELNQTIYNRHQTVQTYLSFIMDAQKGIENVPCWREPCSVSDTCHFTEVVVSLPVYLILLIHEESQRLKSWSIPEIIELPGIGEDGQECVIHYDIVSRALYSSRGVHEVGHFTCILDKDGECYKYNDMKENGKITFIKRAPGFQRTREMHLLGRDLPGNGDTCTCGVAYHLREGTEGQKALSRKAALSLREHKLVAMESKDGKGHPIFSSLRDGASVVDDKGKKFVEYDMLLGQQSNSSSAIEDLHPKLGYNEEPMKTAAVSPDHLNPSAISNLTLSSETPKQNTGTITNQTLNLPSALVPARTPHSTATPEDCIPVPVRTSLNALELFPPLSPTPEADVVRTKDINGINEQASTPVLATNQNPELDPAESRWSFQRLIASIPSKSEREEQMREQQIEMEQQERIAKQWEETRKDWETILPGPSHTLIRRASRKGGPSYSPDEKVQMYCRCGDKRLIKCVDIDQDIIPCSCGSWSHVACQLDGWPVLGGRLERLNPFLCDKKYCRGASINMYVTVHW